MRACMQMLAEQSRRVLYATPTGKLASTFAFEGQVTGTTIHRAFGIIPKTLSGSWSPQDTLDFDAWVIGEISMVSTAIGDDTVRLWIRAEKAPLLIELNRAVAGSDGIAKVWFPKGRFVLGETQARDGDWGILGVGMRF